MITAYNISLKPMLQNPRMDTPHRTHRTGFKLNRYALF